MNARDELACTIHDATYPDSKDDMMTWPPEVFKAADKILAAGYRKPVTIDNEKLVIQDGLLLLDVGSCTCSPYGSSHEYHCGLEYLDDLTKPLERAGYRKPRTIKSAAELEALPFGSAVQTSDDADVVVLRCEGRDFRNQSGYELSIETLWRYGTRPFTVLYEPKAAK